MGKQGRLREKQRRQGQRRLDARWEWRKPILSWDPPPAWLEDGAQSTDFGPQRSKTPVRLPNETEVTHKMIPAPVVERRLNPVKGTGHKQHGQ